ncbi:MAG: DUF4261 domain-containing protein [Bacteroidota bacterium]
MNKQLIILLLPILAMGLFGFKSKKENNTLLGMVLLEDPNSLDLDGVLSTLKSTWELEIDEPSNEDGISVFTIDDYTVAIANIPAPIPGDEVAHAAEYTYLWENAKEEAAKHQGHVIVTIMNAGKDPIAENLLFNKVAGAVLTNSDAIGVYLGGRTLLMDKPFYLENVNVMSDGGYPIFNWIYFGLRQEKNRRSIYTYGMKDFGKKEIEILDSKKQFGALNELLFGIVYYVLESDVTLNHGETIGFSANQKLKITESKGKYLEGNTLKINF